jgi:hypothetical protein
MLLCFCIACVQFGDQEGVRGVFVAMLELLKQKVRERQHCAAEQQCQHHMLHGRVAAGAGAQAAG